MHKIFCHLLSRNDNQDNVRKAYTSWFCDTFPDAEFEREELLMKHAINYAARLGIVLKPKYFSAFLDTELKGIIVKENIHVDGTESIRFEDPSGLATALKITREVMVDTFKEMENQPSNIEDFKVSADSFMTQRLGERIKVILGETYQRVAETGDSIEAAEYARAKIAEVEEIYSKDALEELGVSSTGQKMMDFLTDTGIGFIDRDMGGLYRGQLIGTEAKSGAGKTRFTLGTWLYRAAVVYHRNVLYATLEQSIKEIENILVALHCYYLFGIQVPDKFINEGLVAEEDKPKVEAARIDLFESGKYGKIVIKDPVLYVETFIDKIKMFDNLEGPFDVVAIDYMGLIEQQPSKYSANLKDHEIIARAFKLFKRYCRKFLKGGIAISQFNEKGIDASENDKPITTSMSQGGICVYRNTDANLALSMTDEMKLQNKRRIEQPKLRSSAGFGRQMLDCYPGISLFYVRAKKGTA